MQAKHHVTRSHYLVICPDRNDTKFIVLIPWNPQPNECTSLIKHRLCVICLQKGTVIHELGHAIGFHHEQTRPDRDDHVTVVIENIIPKNLFNFRKYNDRIINTYGVPYDYKSIMHYGQYVSIYIF